MNYNIIYWENVYDDLNEISDYIERMTFSLEKAEQIVWEILASIQVLRFFPYMYQKFYKNYYTINIKNKRIIYFIDEEKKIIIIYRILWQAQNHKNIL